MDSISNLENIRNFCIIAHIDHGKSTLADRILEMTDTVSRREMRAQYLDSMDLERERGITIKLKAVRLNYSRRKVGIPMPDASVGIPDWNVGTEASGQLSPPKADPPLAETFHYQLNLIDTPGHVDFGYEVSRSLAACEGAVLVVDATQGVQAQTVANFYKAKKQNLKILVFINKIDLPQAQTQRVAQQVRETFGFGDNEIIFGSAKTGEGVDSLLKNIVEKIPSPEKSHLLNFEQSREVLDAARTIKPLRALIFDSVYDEHLGALAFIRIFDGSLNTNDTLLFISNKIKAPCLELGIFSPNRVKIADLQTGEVGYVATGIKDLRQIKIGDTITKISNLKSQISNFVEPLPGYQEPKPMVYFGLFTIDGSDFLKLKTALEKIYLTDSSITYEPESSRALGNGFRCGFLGLLHAEIIRERLDREYHLDLITTPPSVPYLLEKLGGEKTLINSASQLPEFLGSQKVLEPYLNVYIFAPVDYIGQILSLCQEHRGTLIGTEYLGNSVKVSYEMPLAETLYDFYDGLKSITSGYASLDYELAEFKSAEVIRLDILVGGEMVDPLSQVVIKEKAYSLGKQMITKLKELLPSQQYVVSLQACIGGKIIAREDIAAQRKNVLAKMSGGDRGRKDKLLEKQKRGKQRLKRFGKMDIPKDVFTKLLKAG